MKVFLHSIYFLILFCFSAAANAAIDGAQCLPDLGNGSICNASDFILTSSVITGPSSCTEGETLNQPITVHVGVTPTAKSRYDIGFFIGENGGSSIQGESCTFSSLSPVEDGSNFDGLSGSGPYRDLDNNQCGGADKNDAEIFHDIVLNNVLCVDSDNNGKLDIDYALTWQNQARASCTASNPEDFFPPSSSKCKAAIGNLDGIEVLPPDIHHSVKITKTASPNIIQEPGGEIRYSLHIENNGNQSLILSSLNDDAFGDVNGLGDCSIPQTLEPEAVYICSFTKNLTGFSPGSHINRATVIAQDETSSATVNASDTAIVIFTSAAQPSASIGDLIWNDLNADGFYTSDEPGINQVLVTLYQNTGNGYEKTADTHSTDGYYQFSQLSAGNYRVIVDTLHSPLNSMVHTGGIIPHDVVLTDNEHYQAADFGFSQAAISVSKLVDHHTISMPSSPVTFTVTITNTAALEVELTQLVDTQFGDISIQCNLPQLLPANDSYACQFTETLYVTDGIEHNNTITAQAWDTDQNELHASDSAHVLFIDANNGSIGHHIWNDVNANGIYDLGEPLLDDVTVKLSGQQSAATITQNGGSYRFSNLSEGDYRVDVTDDNNIISSYILTTANQPYVKHIAAGEIDENANFAYAKGSIEITKTADKNVIHEPGEAVTFLFVITNTSAINLDVQQLTDSQFGNLNSDCGLPRTLSGGDNFSCQVTKNITGNAGDIHSNVIIVTAYDSDNNEFTASDNEAIDIVGVPGGHVGKLIWFDANGDGIKDIDESGIDGITLDLMQNSQVLGSTTTVNGGHYSFSVSNGNYEVKVTDTSHILDNMTLSGGTNPHTGITINNNNYLSADFGYTPIAQQLDIQVTKTASPIVIATPGGDITYSLLITNNGIQAMTLTSLVDDKFGDINGKGSCSVPQHLEPDVSYSCHFTAAISGTAGSKHINNIKAIAEDSLSNNASDSDYALVFFIDPASPSASIGDFVWNDLNADDFYSSNEPGLAGINITLEKYDGHNYINYANTITDNGGFYEFDLLSAGNYRVKPVDQNAEQNKWILTGGIVPHNISLNSNEHYQSADFGYSKAAINVIKTPDQSVVAAPSEAVSYTVTVTNSAALAVVLTSLHDNRFGDLATKGCNLPQNLSAGQSYSCQFTETITGSAGDEHNNTVIATAYDQAQNTIQAADNASVKFIDANNGAIGHFVWNDINANGLYENGEPLVDGVILELSGDKSETTITQNNGLYAFRNLAAGNYTVTITGTDSVLASHYVLTTGNQPYNKTLLSGEIDSGANFGYAQGNISIIKTADKSIIYASGENVVFSFEINNTGNIELLLNNLNDDKLGNLNTACGLPISLSAGNNFNCQLPPRMISGSEGDIYTNVVTIKAYDNASIPHEYLASDKHNINLIANPPGGAIGHLVWYDINNDGIKDNNEAGIDGITIDLIKNGSVVDSTLSSNGGKYKFIVDTNGIYNIEVTDTANILDGAVLSQGSINPYSTTINDNINLNANFGYTLPALTPSISVSKTADFSTINSTSEAVTFYFSITNTSSVPLTITKLFDTVFGPLDGKGNCRTGGVIAIGAAYQCNFTETITGSNGDTHSNIVFSTAVDSNQNAAIDASSWTINFTILHEIPVLSSIALIFLAAGLLLIVVLRQRDVS